MALFHKYDAILGHEPSPITQRNSCYCCEKDSKNSILFLGVGFMAGEFSISWGV